MLDSLTGTGWATEEDCVIAGGLAESKLIEGNALTASLQDAGTSGISEAHGANLHLGNIEQANIVRHCAAKDRNFVGLALHITSDAGNRHRSAVGLRKEQAVENCLIEASIRAASEETVQLDA